MLSEVTVSFPPLLRDFTPQLNGSTAERVRQAERLIIETDVRYSQTLSALSAFLIRTESIASSKIESIDAATSDYALALAGSKANASATALVSAGIAIEGLVNVTGDVGRLRENDVLDAQRTLMESDPFDARFAGNWRTVQNWIGGSDYSPRNALYVPPPADTVEAYIHDLLAFANTNEIAPLLQATIVHAQFESIHPFTDGNGRVGRALINAILRRRNITSSIVIPLASAIVANTQQYFQCLTAYREGDIAPLLDTFTKGSVVAASETQITAETLSTLPSRWREVISRRLDSVASRLLDVLVSTPTIDSQFVEQHFNLTPKTALTGIAILEEAGILHEVTKRQRNRLWVASEVMAELEDLNFRIALGAIQTNDLA